MENKLGVLQLFDCNFCDKIPDLLKYIAHFVHLIGKVKIRCAAQTDTGIKLNLLIDDC
jgi:hypothetical protein